MLIFSVQADVDDADTTKVSYDHTRIVYDWSWDFRVIKGNRA
jgi:hypothetical protein